MWIRRPGPAAAAAVLIGIALIRIAATFTTFSFTTDEPVHIGAGLELLQLHTYTLQPVNPPLPRIVIAALPAMGGMKWPRAGSYYQRADETFFKGDGYKTRLVLGRTGNLLFFVIAAVALFVWTRRQIGGDGAILATLLFTTQPILLGYAGIANHDVPAVAGVAVALVALSSWLDRPDWKRAALLGAAWGFSVLMKFSCIGYVPAACAAIWIVRWLSRSRRVPLNFTILLVPPVAALTVWAGYAFHAAPFVEGVRGVIGFESQFVSYAFGRTTTKGWWWYFPVAVALKTTIPFLVLFAAGGCFAWRSRYRVPYAESATATLAILAVAMPSTLDLGVRYVLPLYVPLTVAAVAAALACFEHRQRWIRGAAMLLVALHVIVSFAAHPDYFPYFNILAGREPGACLVDSNLDWGQDNLRLREAARRLRVDLIGLAIPGNRVTNAEFNAIGLPRNYQIFPYRPRAGWLAVGEHFYRTQHEGWKWLDAFPMQRVGMSIRLYHVPASPSMANENFDVEQVLLPLAGTRPAQHAIWRVVQTVTNKGADTVHLARTNCESAPACEFVVEPGQSLQIAGSDPIRPFVYVSVPQKAIDAIEFRTVAHRIDRQIAGSDVVVPAVRQSEFRAGGVTIRGVPFSPQMRVNARVYTEERGVSEQARVEVSERGQVLATTTIPIYMTGYFTHGDFSTLFPELRATGKALDVRIETHARSWAFITVTDPSERSTVLLPSDSRDRRPTAP